MNNPIPPVSKFMTATPITVEHTTTLAAASKLMKERAVRHLPVTVKGKLIGIITERDIKFAESFDIVDPHKVSVYGAMAEQLYTVGVDEPIDKVVSTMAREKFGCAVVVQDGLAVGLLTTVDVCRAFVELLAGR